MHHSSSPGKHRIRTRSVRTDARGDEPLQRRADGSLVGVSRSGYYAWTKRAPSARALRAQRIHRKVACYNSESVEVSRTPRILADLRKDGETISCEISLGLNHQVVVRPETFAVGVLSDLLGEPQQVPRRLGPAFGRPGGPVALAWVVEVGHDVIGAPFLSLRPRAMSPVSARGTPPLSFRNRISLSTGPWPGRLCGRWR